MAGADMRTIEIGGKAYQVRWIEYKADYQALIDGERGLLPAEQDPWAKIPIPSGTVATIAGFCTVVMYVDSDVTDARHPWFIRDLHMVGGSKNLSRRGSRVIPTWEQPDFDPYLTADTLAGTRFRTAQRDSSVKKVAHFVTRVEAPTLVENFLPNERYIFCLKRDAEGKITSWIGDVLGVIHIVR